MARRGRFGRRPRPTGNLTALIAQLGREQRAAEDRVMFDAYQNGGKVDGKPVDDNRIRAYIQSRRNGFASDDPLYDEWNNRLVQIDFKISEEKIQLSFQQGKVGAGAVANFYRQQLKSLPKDSAFYREVASRAAQWAKAASGAARGAARSKLTAALKAKLDGVQRTWNSYSAIEAIVTQAAQRAGLIAGNQTLTDADASDLQALFASGIIGATGKAITFDDWRNASVAAYKGFDTAIAVNTQLNRGTKELTDNKGKFLDQNLVRINTIDDRSAYELAYEAMYGPGGAIEQAQGNPTAILEAAAKYAATLGQIRANAELGAGLVGNDPEFIGGLQNEITAVTTGEFSGPTVFDLQSTSGEGITTQDGMGTAQSTAQVIAAAKALDEGRAYYGQNTFGGYVPSGGGPMQPYGVQYFAPGSALDPFGRNGLGPNMQKSLVTINGKPTIAYLAGQAITTAGLMAHVPVGGDTSWWISILKGPVDARLPVDTAGQATDIPIGDLPDGEGGMINVSNLTPNQIRYLLSTGLFELVEGEVAGYVFQSGAGKTTYGVFDSVTGALKFTDENPFVGALVPTEGGYSVIAPTGFSPAGDKIIPSAVQTIDLGSADNLITDATVLPSDLRTLADSGYFGTDAAAQSLREMADRRQAKTADEHNVGQGERNVQNRRASGATPPGLIRSVTEFAGGALTDFIRDAMGVATPPPALQSGGLGGPPTGVSGSGMFIPPPSSAGLGGPPTGVSGSGSFIPPPPPPDDEQHGGVGGGGGASGGGSMLPPPTPPGGGGGRPPLKL